jgi:hypothetical protein
MSTKKETATNQDTEMEKTQMIVRKQVEGAVQYNNAQSLGLNLHPVCTYLLMWQA